MTTRKDHLASRCSTRPEGVASGRYSGDERGTRESSADLLPI